jgi:hypothetical protein
MGAGSTLRLGQDRPPPPPGNLFPAEPLGKRWEEVREEVTFASAVSV